MSKIEIIIIAFLILIDIVLYFRSITKKDKSVIYFVIGHKAGELTGAEEMWNVLYKNNEKKYMEKEDEC